jgi:hypothetical protein
VIENSEFPVELDLSNEFGLIGFCRSSRSRCAHLPHCSRPGELTS